MTTECKHHIITTTTKIKKKNKTTNTQNNTLNNKQKNMEFNNYNINYTVNYTKNSHTIQTKHHTRDTTYEHTTYNIKHKKNKTITTINLTLHFSQNTLTINH